MDLEKIKEAQARHATRGVGYMTESAVEDRALLLAAVPDLLKEIERVTELARVRGNTILDAGRMLDDALAEIERLKRLAREGWEHVREVYEGEGVEPGERVAAALKEIEAAS